MSVCQRILSKEALTREVHFCTFGILPQNTGQVLFVYEGHPVSVKVAGTKKRRKCLFMHWSIPVAVLIGTRQMASQTTRRGWSGLRLERMLVFLVFLSIFCLASNCKLVWGTGCTFVLDHTIVNSYFRYRSSTRVLGKTRPSTWAVNS